MSKVKVTDINSGSATSGQVPIADGSGGAAWGDQSGGGGGGVGGNVLSNASVSLSTDYTTDFTSGVAIPWDTEDYDNGGLWSAGDPTKFVIPASLAGNYATVTGRIRLDNSNSGYKQLIIGQFDSGGTAKKYAVDFLQVSTTTGIYLEVVLADVEVASGDYFTIQLVEQSDTSSTVRGVNTTGFSIVVYQPIASSDHYPVAADFSITLNSPTVNDSGYGFSMSGAVDASLLRGLLNPVPGGDFSVITRVQGEWSHNYNAAGILFRDTAGKYVSVNLVYVSGGWAETTQWSDQTTFASGANTYDLNDANWPEWLKADFDSATNDITASISWDGNNWYTLGTSTYLGTCDAFGLGVSCRSTYTVWASFSYYLVQ